MEFDWDEANVEKLAWHDVEPEEAVEVFANPHIKGKGPYVEGGETRWDIVGRTDTEPARILRVVYTWRGERIRVVNAFSASRPEAKKYRGRHHDGQA